MMFIMIFVFKLYLTVRCKNVDIYFILYKFHVYVKLNLIRINEPVYDSSRRESPMINLNRLLSIEKSDRKAISRLEPRFKTCAQGQVDV
jgi:hypothetical protein